MTAAQLADLAQSLGVAIDETALPGYFSIRVDAPAGRIWPDGVHRVFASDCENTSSARYAVRREIAEKIKRGFIACHCDDCQERESAAGA